LVRRWIPFRGARYGQAGIALASQDLLRPGWVDRAAPEGAADPAVRGSTGEPRGARHGRTRGADRRRGLKSQHIGLLPPSLAFVATLADVTLPSRTFHPAAVKPVGITCQTLLTFAPSFPTRPDLTTRLLAELGYLSWGCPKKPLRRISSGSPLPDAVHEQARVGHPSGREGQLSSMFRPHGFSPSRRVPPPSDGAPTLAGLHSTVPTSHTCCIVLPTLGFTTFPPPPRRHRPFELRPRG